MGNELIGGYPGNRRVSFGDAIRLLFVNYFQFEGRSSRGAYWFAQLFYVITSVCLAVIAAIAFPFADYNPVSLIFDLAVFVPMLALGVRRLHDVGRSGWWLLISITIIGIIPLIYWFAQPGQRFENRFGADDETGAGRGAEAYGFGAGASNPEPPEPRDETIKGGYWG